MPALEGERTLLGVASLVITSHRVRETLKGSGAGRVTSIMLNEVSGCAVTHVSKPYLLNLAGLILFGSIVSAIVGIPSSGESLTVLILGILATLILGVAYFATRKNVVRVSSASTSIEVPLSGVGFDKAVEIIDAVEWAKNEHYWMRRNFVAAQPVQQTASVPQAWATAPQG